MSNCKGCQKKFGFLKYNRAKCMECGQGYCLQCIRKANGLRIYCDTCLILNTRPVNRAKIMNIRSKEVKLYLARRKISTDHCLEKEELVDRFLWYVDIEPNLNKNRSKNGINLNNFMSNLTNSMPNLFEAGYRRYTEATSSQSNQSQEPSPSGSAPQGSPANTQTNRSSNPDVNSPAPAAEKRKLIRLSDIKNVEDISNLSVKQLKELLFINRIDFKGCVEKEELIKKAVELWVDAKSQDPENLGHEDLCKICMDAPLNSVLLECGHIATCIDCGKQLAECPICRQYIVRVVHTFKA